MKKFEMKSLILGIGIGIVLSSIIGLIFSLGYSAAAPEKSMTKEQIITQAKKYGMVQSKSILNDSTETNTKDQDTTDNEK